MTEHMPMAFTQRPWFFYHPGVIARHLRDYGMSGNIGDEYVRAVLTGLRFVLLMVISAWIAGKLQGLFHSHNTFVFIGLLMAIWFVLSELLERAGKRRRSTPAEKLRKPFVIGNVDTPIPNIDVNVVANLNG